VQRKSRFDEASAMADLFDGERLVDRDLAVEISQNLHAIAVAFFVHGRIVYTGTRDQGSGIRDQDGRQTENEERKTKRAEGPVCPLPFALTA
jgi:hypothetical protein